MNPMDQSRRGIFRPIGGRGCLLVSSVVVLALAGCEGFPSQRKTDPLLGIPNPPQQATASTGPTNTPAVAASDQIPPPPMPASYTAPGPAALAGGETPAPDQVRDLRIPGNTVMPTSLPGSSAVRGVSPGGVTVGQPEPATNGSTSHLVPVPSAGAAVRPIGVSTTSSPPGTAAANIRTFEEAQQYLEQHRVDCQHLEKVDNGWWKFDCSGPNPSNPKVRRTYQTSGPYSDPLSAIRAVIAKMEQNPQ
ncbi:MAG TPA: hypothetical protein VMG10_28245 [Gemmataceae bacterium]|nr:hypothetical protein [Gemmataceae bacterium]